MPPTPLVEWEEQEIADGAVSFADQLQRLLNNTIPVTTSHPLVVTTTPSTVQPFVEKIAHAVVNVVPQLADAVQRELQPMATDHPTTTVVSTTTPVVPTPPCGPDFIQVSKVIL
jgi:hypothetical protein